MSEHIHHVDDASFEAEILKSPVPVLVDFWAEWCGPCKAIAPLLEEVARLYAGRLKVCKVDVDANQDTSLKYNIRSIPTLMLFANGKAEGNLLGSVPKSRLTQFIDSHIA